MSNRIEGERVFCYSCQNEWDRAHGGLQCPRCDSEFVEILAPGSRPDAEDPPEIAPESPMRSLHDHNPWATAPDPDEGDVRTVHFNSSGYPGSSNYTFTRTYTYGGSPNTARQQGGNQQNYADAARADIMRNFEGMFTGLLGPATRLSGGNFGGSININGRTTHFGAGTHDTTFAGRPGMAGPPDVLSMLFPGSRGPQGQGSGLNLLSHFLNPANARSGDTVWSQEAFDGVMSQLMDQNQQNGAPPASEDRINSLPTKKIDQAMLGSDNKAECSICMDNVEVGTEVTILPCQHWFHFECIKSWLSEHDTCPHCRKSITPAGQQETAPRQSGRRRSSRRSSSVASPVTQVRSGTSAETGREGGIRNPISVDDDPSPSALRNAREQYYGRSESSRYRHSDEEREQRPSSERRDSRRSNGSGGGREEGGGGGGGVGGWLRNRMNFS